MRFFPFCFFCVLCRVTQFGSNTFSAYDFVCKYVRLRRHVSLKMELEIKKHKKQNENNFFKQNLDQNFHSNSSVDCKHL